MLEESSLNDPRVSAEIRLFETFLSDICTKFEIPA